MPRSRAKFKAKYQLSFPFLADEDRREYKSIRAAYLMDAQGTITRVFEDVRPAAHSAELPDAIRSLQP